MDEEEEEVEGSGGRFLDGFCRESRGLTSFLLLAGVSFSRTCGPERSLCSMINWPARFNMMLSAMQA